MLMCLQFDTFLLCPTEKIVLYGEIKLEIRGKDFEVLHLLLQHPKRLVRKDIFLQEIWRDAIVEETNIAVCITNIRKALGEYSGTPLIETVRGEGYRLRVDVVEVKKETRRSDAQPEIHSITASAQRHKNKAGELQSQQYNAALNISRILTGNGWDMLRLSIITLSVILLFIGAIYYLMDATSEVFYFKPFLPGSFLLAIYIVVEAVRRLPIFREISRRAELESLKDVGTEIRNRSGYEVEEIEVHIVIRDLKGTCHVRWMNKNIKKARPGVTLSHIPGKLYFSRPDSSFVQWPTLSFKDQTKYEIEFIRQDSNFCEFHVVLNDFTGNSIGYEYTADAERAFYMSEEEIAGQQYPYEWFGIEAIFSAIERAVIKVYFPKGYHVNNIHPDACIGMRPIGTSDRLEVERIIAGFERGEGEASLVVEKPKFGYIYYLRWKPLPEALIRSINH